MVLPGRFIPWLRCGVALLALTLSGCGFQLRGTAGIPEGLSPVYIEGGGPLVKSLQRILTASGQALAANAAEAKSSIRIIEERAGSRVLSVNREGKVVALELTYQVRFSATSTAGKTPIAPQTLNLARDYVNPDTEVLGKQLEADLMYNDLREDAARQILQRLTIQWR